MLTRDIAAATTEMVLKELNISKENWRKLLEMPAADLLAVQSKFSPVPPFIDRSRITENTDGNVIRGFGPVVDGKVLPYHPFDPSAPEMSRNKPLMTGWNEDEYTFFARQNKETEVFKIGFAELPARLERSFGKDAAIISDAYRKAIPNATAPEIFVAVSSINMMGLGSIEIAEKKSMQNGAPVYLYNFGYKSNATIPGTDFPMGTPHAMDISFKFNNVAPSAGEGQPAAGFGGNGPDAYIASRNMAEIWCTFARTGIPSAQGVPVRPAYNAKDKATMRIDTKCEVIFNRFGDVLDMWRSIGRL
jgi:para-nitrobenzyl esterase